jgi:transcriptional regulator with XRE-family HTH domain
MTTPDDPRLREAVKRLLQHLAEDERSSSAIAQEAGVSQPTVSRLRRSRGRRARWSGPFNTLCSFYRVPLPDRIVTGRGYNELLRDAIIDAWDGTNENGQALLTLIRGLKSLIKPKPNSSRSSRGNP